MAHPDPIMGLPFKVFAGFSPYWSTWNASNFDCKSLTIDSGALIFAA
jgi:hypothetical protein